MHDLPCEGRSCLLTEKGEDTALVLMLGNQDTSYAFK
jgi:hypothetical protein